MDAFHDLYQKGCLPRFGQVIMIVGRSGSQKSGLALWWADEMDLPTLYFSADMSPFTASARLASKRMGLTTEEVEKILHQKDNPRRAELLSVLDDSKITFSFGSPIRYDRLEYVIEAYVERYDRYPAVLVIDNLMDIEGAESDYTAQMEAMSIVTELARETGITIILLHHASDKSWDAKSDPWNPPARSEVKGGLSEKPELSLSVALEPDTLAFRVAVIKQRMGPSDPSARRFSVLRAEPELTRFHRRNGLERG